MPEVKFWRGNSGQINNREIVDGQLLYNTDTGEVLIDVENRRVSSWEGLHPVGSWWISNDPTSPAELFGGTWEKLEGRFLLAADALHQAGTTGGSVTHSHGVTGGARCEANRDVISFEYTDTENWTANWAIQGNAPGYAPEPENTHFTSVVVAGTTDAQSNFPLNYATYMWLRTA